MLVSIYDAVIKTSIYDGVIIPDHKEKMGSHSSRCPLHPVLLQWREEPHH